MNTTMTEQTQNESYGFYGTIYEWTRSDCATQTIWGDTFNWMLKNAPKVDGKKVTPQEIRGFLDSKAGRHIADQLRCGKNIDQIEGLFTKGYWFPQTISSFRKDPW